MPTTLLPAPQPPAQLAAPARPAAQPGLSATTADDALVRSLFGPDVATVEELVARDIEAFTQRRLARA